MRNAVLVGSLLALLVTITGCSSGSGKGPVLASSGGQASYAVRYSDELAAASKAVAEAQAQEKALSAGFAAHVDALKKPDWEKVLLVVNASDQAGRSADFATAHGDADAVKELWDADKDIITAKVNGNAQHAIKEAGCSAEVAGPISFALNDAITKQLQKRLRARNDAFVVIERHKTTLGPQNVAALEKLADDVAQASYDVNVLMVVQRERMSRLVADKDDVKKTLDRVVNEETAFQAEAGRTEADKKASAERVTAATKTKSEVDASATQAATVSKHMDASTDAAKKDYEKALKALRAKVEEKKKAEPAAARAK